MGLLKDFLRIDAERRAAHQVLRQEAHQRRLQIEELSAEARRKRDEIGILEDGLRRLAEDVVRSEDDLLALQSKAEEHDRDTVTRKAEAVRSALGTDRRETSRVVEDFRRVRSAFDAERDRLLAQADSGKMMDNFFQIEAFLKDTGQPIPDAARKALLRERGELLGRIGPLVAPPPSPDSVFRATIVYSTLAESEPSALVAFGLPDENEAGGVYDLATTLLLGAYASAVEKLGATAPRPRRDGGAVVFEAAAGSRPPEDVALDLFLAVEEGLKKAAAAAAVRCELAGVFVEPEIAAAVFPREAVRKRV
jgi:hypothetical protein